MSLPLIAKHLESQGRGEDNHLVHMTSGELHALQNLAEKHGGSLTINPSTGLPEAGFLSAILPTIAGAAMVALAPETGGLSLLAEPMVAGAIVGAADYAITGSLKQGLMAGLGAWGGAGLASGLEAAGTQAAVQEGGDAAAKQFATSQATVSGAGSAGGTGAAGAVEYGGMAPQQALNATANGLPSQQFAAQQIQGMFNLPVGAQDAYINALQAPNANVSNIVESAGRANAITPPDAYGDQIAQRYGNIKAGLGDATSSLKNAGNFLMNNKGVALGLAGSMMANSDQPTMPGQTGQTNPFNIKPLSPNFHGQYPAQPNPPYQAQYQNYVQNPYSMATAADGGLMGAVYPTSMNNTNAFNMGNQQPASLAFGEPNNQNVSMNEGGIMRYASGDLASTKRPLMEAIAEKDHVYTDTDPDTKLLDSYNAALMLMKKNNKLASLKPSKSGLSAVNPLGSDIQTLSHDQLAAEAAMNDIKANSPSVKNAKEGGLQAHLGGYSDGGRLLKGPGDGVSDGIPAVIGGKQPARLADGEFVIPARIVSELGNGSTDAGAKRLYAMMDRVKKARSKAKDIAADTKAYKYLPA